MTELGWIIYLIGVAITWGFLFRDLLKKEQSLLFQKVGHIFLWFGISLIPAFNIMLAIGLVGTAIRPMFTKRIWK